MLSGRWFEDNEDEERRYAVAQYRYYSRSDWRGDMVSWDHGELLRTVSIRLLLHFPKATDRGVRPHASKDSV